MSVKDINKKIIVSSALTGCIVFTMDYDDFMSFPHASDYFNLKVSQLIEDEERCFNKGWL